MARRPNANVARQILLFSAPDVHYLFNAYNRAVHHYNQEVSAAAGGLSAPAAPSTKRLDKARAEFLAAVEALPHGQVRDAYMDEFNNTHVLRYNGPSMRVLDKKIKSTLRKRHAVKSGLAYNPHTVCQDCGQEDAAVRHADGHVACYRCGAPQSAIETRYNSTAPGALEAELHHLHNRLVEAEGHISSGHMHPEERSRDAFKLAALKQQHRALETKIKRMASPTKRRKNASFTGSALHGGGDDTRMLVKAFYAQINEEIPGSTPVPIPPPESVQPKHDAQTQAFIFADYAVRKFAPIALDAAGYKAEAAKLRKLRKIVDADTALPARQAAAEARGLKRFAAHVAADAAYYAARVAAHLADAKDYIFAAHVGADAAGYAGEAACKAAKLNPDATWEAVNEMLAAL